jgi:hypothetical protein
MFHDRHIITFFQTWLKIYVRETSWQAMFGKMLHSLLLCALSGNIFIPDIHTFDAAGNMGIVDQRAAIGVAGF